MPGVIVPRKTVGEVQRLIEDNEAEVKIELSQGKIRFTIGNVVLTSKLIDGTFPDYGRVIPQNNDKELIVDKKDFEAAVDRVSTISSERGRAVKLALSAGKLVLSVTNPDSGSATEELEVEYASDALDIGFNSRYLLDIAAQIEGEVAVLQAGRSRLADAGAGQGQQGRALRADADAGVRLGDTRRSSALPLWERVAPNEVRRLGEGSAPATIAGRNAIRRRRQTSWCGASTMHRRCGLVRDGFAKRYGFKIHSRLCLLRKRSSSKSMVVSTHFERDTREHLMAKVSDRALVEQ